MPAKESSVSDLVQLQQQNQTLQQELDNIKNQLLPQMRVILGQLEQLKGERKNMRALLSSIYLSGSGLELGALGRPLPTRENVQVSYVDRLDVPGLRTHYPELADMELVDVDIIDDGETLTTVAAGSQDFIIANHFLEHCRNPIGTLETLLAKLKVRGQDESPGVLYVAVPDKHQCFDRNRPVTPFEHTLDDYKHGSRDRGHLDLHHFSEWSHLVEGLEGAEADELTERLVKADYSIHFHVWDLHSFLDFLLQTARVLGETFEIIQYVQAGDEIIALLGKKA